MGLPWSFVSKITNSKHQIPNKSQIPIFNDQNLSGPNIVSNFGHWKLFDICDLIFVIFELQTKKIPSGDKTRPGPLGYDSLLICCKYVI
jgi:hypothetical protein